MRLGWVFCVWVLGLHLAHAAPTRSRRARHAAEISGLARSAYQAGDAAYRKGQYQLAAQRFEQAYLIANFPTILFDVGQSYRRWYETEHNMTHLRKAIAAYRGFVSQAPTAAQRPVAQKFLALLELELADKVSKVEDEPAAPPPAPAAPAPVIAPTPTVTALATSKPATDKSPVYKKWWLWTAVGAGAVAIALGVNLGVGLNQAPQGSLQW
jgi:tetratricopeptide (TPR) repeat protein